MGEEQVVTSGAHEKTTVVFSWAPGDIYIHSDSHNLPTYLHVYLHVYLIITHKKNRMLCTSDTSCDSINYDTEKSDII